MEKLWVTQFGWLWLCTAVDMGMTITNLWKLFTYVVNRDHYEKSIGIRELLEQLYLNFFDTNSSADTGTLARNTPSRYEVNEESTCRHTWELPSNYPVFTVVMVIYYYVDRTWRFIVTPDFLYNIYDD